jgi:uncharacterized membrane protein
VAALWIRRPVLAAITGPLTIVSGYFVLHEHGWWFVALAFCLGAAQWISSTEGAVYVAGHVSVLAAGMRVVGLVALTHSVAYQTDSLLLACWGIGVLAWGLGKDSRLNTRLGLALLGLVVAKLYVWDVWSLDRVYRITAFLGLGGLLLFASWIYSRKSGANRV